MIEDKKNIEYISIDSLNLVKPDDLFSEINGEKVVSIFDIDGVLFRMNNSKEFVSRMKVAKKIADMSDKVIVDTARIVTNGERETDMFPFISERFVNRMKKFFGDKEDNKKVECKTGLKNKFRGCFDSNNEFYVNMMEMLKDGYHVFWFGSSRFDYEKAKRLGELANASNLEVRKIHHYNTGLILI